MDHMEPYKMFKMLKKRVHVKKKTGGGALRKILHNVFEGATDPAKGLRVVKI